MTELRREFEATKKELLSDLLLMGGKSINAVEKSIRSLLDKDITLSNKVIVEDDEIDDLYKQIDVNTIALIARQTPVAGDLRMLTSILIITLHLERIGDLASNIAKRTISIIDNEHYFKEDEIFDIIHEMQIKSVNLLDKALRGFINKDKKSTPKLHRLDDTVDDLNKRLVKKIGQFKDEENFEWLLDMILISRWLERIGDQAVDISDMTRFMVSGKLPE